jgi:hypothetical protein
MSELLANISLDIKTDGKLHDSALGSQLMNNVAYLDLNQVTSNMQNKYSGLGIPMNVNSDELKSYVDQFKNNSGFKQTLFINYPTNGKYGLNILADSFVVAKQLDDNGIPVQYSVRAELPAGNSSLKIIIKTISQANGDAWGGFYPSSLENWLASSWDNNLRGNTWTVYESGIPADGAVFLDSDCTIEYYENGATVPTKVKVIKVI